MKVPKLLILLIFTVSFIASCKKENAVGSEKMYSSHDEICNFKVDKRGFLIFASIEDILKFNKFLNNGNKEKIIDEIMTKGFKIRKNSSTLFSRSSDSPYNYYFDENGLLQVGDLLLKISHDDKFLYVVKEQNLDPIVYEKLLLETFDELTMNKINVNRLEENFNLLALMDFTPFGINEPENTGFDKRPMFGTTTTLEHYCIPNALNPGFCDCGDYEIIHHYAFWIQTSWQWGNVLNNTIQPCD